ncbi:ATP-binding protein [Actinacidiphila reveromycinica]|nr:NB-ARC domain-containing protein [Streptomyces sp. SN-593]
MKGFIPQETTGFVGRGPELARLGGLLASRRLLTLTGVGGVGKTRLAQRAAARLAELSPGTFPDGVWWADLATLDGDDLLLATVSDAVDLSDHSPRMPVDALCEWLAGKRLLLVLDSCEHLVEPVARLVDEVLGAVPGLSMLATSRRPLGCMAEQVVEVDPLPVAEDARELFAQRVRAQDPDALSAEGATEAASLICRKLEGIPLAVELAAAQVGPDTSVADVAARLDSRFDVLVRRSGFVWPRRHLTLRAAIGWSHELCAPLDRLLWARLTVFRGSFDLASARAVTAGGPLDPDAVAAGVERLVAQSVVRRDGPRYRMLDTIREYGREWLRGLGEEEALAARHADHVLALVRRAERNWSSGEQGRCYRTVEEAHTDVCTALEHLADADPERGAELAGLLVFFWTCCGRLKEARAALERALAVPDPRASAAPPSADRPPAAPPSDPPPAAPPSDPTPVVPRDPVPPAARRPVRPGPARTRALAALGVVLTLQGAYDQALRVSEEATRAADDDGDKEGQLGAAYLAGLLALLTGRAEDARRVVRAALDAAPGLAFDSPARLRCHLVAVFASTGLGDLDRARGDAVELRAHCEQIGEWWTRSYLDYQLSLIALFQGRPDEAATRARAMLDAKRQLGDAFGTALGLDLLAAALAAAGRAEHAVRVYGHGETFWRSVGHPQRGTPELRAVREEYERTARTALGDTRYARAYADGAASPSVPAR